MADPVIPQGESLQDLFSRDPRDISDDEFRNRVLPEMRRRRELMEQSEKKGEGVPRGKKLKPAAPPLDLAALGLVKPK